MLSFATPLIVQEESHIEAAKELLRLMNSEQSLERSQEQLYSYMKSMMTQFDVTEERRPTVDRHLKKMVQALNEEMTREKMEPYVVDAYVKVYSEQELQELNEIYATELDQKFVAKMPELAEASMQASQRMMQDLMPRIQAIQDELHAELAEEQVN